MKDQDLLAYIQPVFIDLDMNTVEPAIGAHRMDKVYAWKSMLDMGIHTSGGSDAPVVSFDAMENIYFAVTRKNISGQPQEGWIPSEKMSVDEAVKLFTKNAAYASYTEDENGTIEVEKNADFVVLEKDIYKIDPDEIKPMIAMPFHPSNVYTIDELNANLADILHDVEQKALVSLDGAVDYSLQDKIIGLISLKFT